MIPKQLTLLDCLYWVHEGQGVVLVRNARIGTFAPNFETNYFVKILLYLAVDRTLLFN